MSNQQSSTMTYKWPEEKAKKVAFYFHQDGKNVTSSSSDKYHLTVIPNRSNDNDNETFNLILYHSETKEVVDMINTEDIIGAELEIALDEKIGNNNDDVVGANHPHAKERADKMAEYESKIGKTLIGGKIQDFSAGDSSTSAAYLNIFCYPRSLPKPGLSALIKNCFHAKTPKKSLNLDEILTEDHDDNMINNVNNFGHRFEKHRRYKLFPTEDFSDTQHLMRAIRKVANIGHFESNEIKTNKFLVVVNPFSGTKQAKNIYEKYVCKMLRECGVDHDVLVTQYAGHACDRMKKDNTVGVPDISQYSAIISMGGDGLLSEIINGVRSRKDCDEICKKLKFGIVGCGTCNGLAASLLYAAKVNSTPLLYLLPF